jgi:DNA/RNA-binding domain of Phe-tRNA-synthetase-like protein
VPAEFTLAPELAAIVRPAVIWWTGATVVLHEHRLDPLLAEAEATVRIAPPPESAAVRTMYKKVGIDPTKTRPSSEALLRRVRKGDTIPRINSAVDIINWCSLEFQLPYGLYDAAKISGNVTMRTGREGENYAGIRKDEVHVGGRITVADHPGPFGNPTSDSLRTMVTPDTTELLVVIYAPREIATARIEQVVEATAERMRTILGGSPSRTLVLDNQNRI